MSSPFIDVELFTAVPAILRASQDLVPCSNRYSRNMSLCDISTQEYMFKERHIVFA